jgi:hypothetical protein
MVGLVALSRVRRNASEVATTAAMAVVLKITGAGIFRRRVLPASFARKERGARIARLKAAPAVVVEFSATVRQKVLGGFSYSHGKDTPGRRTLVSP